MIEHLGIILNADRRNAGCVCMNDAQIKQHNTTKLLLVEEKENEPIIFIVMVLRHV